MRRAESRVSRVKVGEKAQAIAFGKKTRDHEAPRDDLAEIDLRVSWRDRCVKGSAVIPRD
jgi:hypothetical protein